MRGGKVRTLYLVGLLLFCHLGHAFVYLNTARIAYYNERDYERAKKACLAGIKAGKENFELYGILGGSEIGLSNWQAASEALIKAFGIDSVKTIEWIGERGGGENYFYQAFFFSARELYDEEQYEDVLKNLGYAQLLIPGDIRIYILKGAAYYKLGNREAANKEYKRALDIDPENPDVYFLIGKSLYENREFDSSIVYFDNAVKYYDFVYDRKAKIIFQNLPSIDKKLSRKIIILYAEQRMDELDQLLKTDLEFDEGLNVHQQTVVQFFKAAEDLARSYYFAGMAYYNLQEDSLALMNLLKSLEAKPIDLDALYFAGEIEVKLGDYQDAIGHFERLTQLKQDDLAAWFYLGVCYTQLKEYEKAIDVYENRVLQIDPKHIDTMRNLAFIYSELGDKEKSREYIRRVKELQKQEE